MARTSASGSRGGPEGVVLPEGHTGSSLFHALLAGACAEFPDALRPAELPSDPAVFKRDYGDVLARFEAARVVAPERIEIARHLVRASQQALVYVEGARRVPLVEHLSAAGAARCELASVELGAGPGLRPEVTLDGQTYRRRAILGLAERLAEQQHMTRAALLALRWIVEHGEAQGGHLDLHGHSFVALGAGAELAPTRMLLEAGARVLWIDRSDPGPLLAGRDGLAGSLVRPPGADLLLRPREVVAAIRAFAERHGPVHLGMFAYASGSSQEWRLGAVMHAIASRLPADSLRSVSLLVSPTTVSTLQPECVSAAQRRLAQAPRWKSALRLAGLLRAPGHFTRGGVAIARATVSIQGLSYQAAQHVSKLMAAETFAVHGADLDADRQGARPLTVSANVAGITRTRSLEHPLFQAAFIGAPHFGVRIFDPPATRALSGLLMLHDLLNPQAPGAVGVQPDDVREKAAGLLAQQVHGGIYGLPYVLEHTIRMAALIGMGRKPSVLLRGSAPQASRGSELHAAPQMGGGA